MHSLKAMQCVSVAALLYLAPQGRAQCTAPGNWFPHASTPKPDFHAPQNDCEFHQWSWQTFLWLTQPTGNGRIRLLDLPTAAELFQPGRGPATLDAATIRQFKQQKLILTPRVTKRSAATEFNDIRQAGLRGVLVDQKGRPVYYAVHVSPTYYQFVRTNRLFLYDYYRAAPARLSFPVRSISVKSSWRIAAADEPGVFKTDALAYRLACVNNLDRCQGADVILDRSQADPVTVALVGIHIVGVVEDHPEFIWSTFEHIGNAPVLPAGMNPDSPNPVSGGAYSFYTANTPAKECNVSNARTVALDVSRQLLSPPTNVFRQFDLGGGDSADQANIKSLNDSVHSQLEVGSVWKNYSLMGSVWFLEDNNLDPDLQGPFIQRRTTGSVRLSNSTMETFSQLGRRNCFACHDTASRPDLGIPAKNLNLNHVLIDGLLQGYYVQTTPARVVEVDTVKEFKNYAQIQNVLNEFVKRNNVPIWSTPYGPFWAKKNYKEFTEGNIPGVTDRAGKPLRMLVVKSSKDSNLIRMLRGTKGTVFDPVTGSLGRLPPSGPFMNDLDIDRIAGWIDRGCPNE